MLRISKMTDYGVALMAHMARSPGALHNAGQLAQAVHMPASTVSKLLKALARGELLVSYRGANGGYRLARSPSSISVLDIIDAMEGPLGITECASAGGLCAQEPICSVRGNWHWINRTVRQALSMVTLKDMTKSTGPMPVGLSLCTCGERATAVNTD